MENGLQVYKPDDSLLLKGAIVHYRDSNGRVKFVFCEGYRIDGNHVSLLNVRTERDVESDCHCTCYFEFVGLTRPNPFTRHENSRQKHATYVTMQHKLLKLDDVITINSYTKEEIELFEDWFTTPKDRAIELANIEQERANKKQRKINECTVVRAKDNTMRLDICREYDDKGWLFRKMHDKINWTNNEMTSEHRRNQALDIGEKIDEAARDCGVELPKEKNEVSS